VNVIAGHVAVDDNVKVNDHAMEKGTREGRRISVETERGRRRVARSLLPVGDLEPFHDASNGSKG
jgi:hypothetical protein